MIVGCPHCQLRYDVSHRDPREAVKCRCGASFMVPNLSNTARAWNCPNCGGATDPANSKCEFCGVYLVFARCPDCFTLVVEDSKFCHQCGEDLRRPAVLPTDKKTRLACPRCKAKLRIRNIDDYHVDHCLACGGVWLDHDVLERVLRDKGNQKTVQAYLGHQAVREPGRDYFPIVYLKCPRCEDIMHRRNFGKTSGLIVDECVAHGIWFDKNELASVIAFSRSSMKDVRSKQTPIEYDWKERRANLDLASNDMDINELWSIVGGLLDDLVD